MREPTPVRSRDTLDELANAFTKVASEDVETLVSSNVHTHVGDHHGVDLFTPERTPSEISAFVGNVRAITDTLTGDYAEFPVDG